MRGWIHAIHLLLDLKERRQRERERPGRAAETAPTGVFPLDELATNLRHIRLSSAGLADQQENR